MALIRGVIPVMTFCSPAVAGLTLLPVLREYGKRWALSAYVAVAALSLMLMVLVLGCVAVMNRFSDGEEAVVL